MAPELLHKMGKHGQCPKDFYFNIITSNYLLF